MRHGNVWALAHRLFILLLTLALLSFSSPAYAIGELCGGCGGRGSFEWGSQNETNPK